jgi:hypothetical protein
VATTWPVTKALSDPDLGYVEVPLLTQTIGTWRDVDPETTGYVLIIEGITGMRTTPPPGLLQAEPVGSRRWGNVGAHIWRVAPLEM